jgi:uncharacterized membrane protein YgdD (TMEM256/DUF423 family)
MWMVHAAMSGFIAVAAGAFAAHGLKGRLGEEHLQIFETAARYQMYHALALLAVAWLSHTAPSPAVGVAGWAFVIGTILFSGSLYVLALTGMKWLGAITPFGGVAFLVGWAALAWAGFKSAAA